MMENINLKMPVEKDYVIDVSLKPLRSFEELNPEEQAKVLELKKTLEDVSDVSLMNFSASTASTISRDTDEFLRTTKLNDLQEFNEIMLNLSNQLKSVDTERLSEIKDNPFERFPIIGTIVKKSIVKKVNAVVEKQQSIEKVVFSTENILQKISLSLQEDLTRCSSMREKNIEYAKEMEFECVALQLRKKELESELDSFMNSSNYDVRNLDNVEKVGRINDAIQEISRDIDTTARFRLLAIQNMSTLRITKNADIALIKTIQKAVMELIPQWKKAFTTAILSYRLYNAASVLEVVNQTTEEILEQSAKITSAAVLKSAEMIEKPAVSSEKLRKINDTIVSMCNEVVETTVRAQEIREKDLPEMKKMEQEVLSMELNKKNEQIPNPKPNLEIGTWHFDFVDPEKDKEFWDSIDLF